MILAALNDYYQRLLDDEDSGISPPGYSSEKISYVIVLSADGTVLDVLDLRDTNGKKRVVRELIVPQKPPGGTSNILPKFLWDKTSYVLGVGDEVEQARSKLSSDEILSDKERERLQKKINRTAEEQDAFKSLHRKLLADSDAPAMKALLAFLDAWTPEQFHTNPYFIRQGAEMMDANVVFRFGSEHAYLHEHPAARSAWAKKQAESAIESRGMCLVTGEMSSLERLHPPIKSFVSTGSVIVAYQEDAYTSYRGTLARLSGKKKENDSGANAPVSKDAAFAYTTALNHLLRRDPNNRQRLQIGDTTVVFWAQAPEKAEAEEGENLLAAFFDPKDEDAQTTQRLHDALQLVRQGRPLRDLGGHLEDGTRIFVLGLAPNASRLSIRFWETATLARFAERLADHFDDLALKPTPWRRAPTPQALALATAPIYDGKAKADDIPPLLAGELARAVLTGARYPQSILSTVVMRFRADGQITGLRVALCKGVLSRAARLDKKQGKPSKQGEPPVSLDTNCKDTGYLLGRLFSLLENIQRAALGEQVKATIRDRYYGAASATPASIFPVLLRNVQNHLSKLSKEKMGLAVTLEKEMRQIVNDLPTKLPRSLPIEAQGGFAIGYYHQAQARYAGSNDQDTTDTETKGEAV